MNIKYTNNQYIKMELNGKYWTENSITKYYNENKNNHLKVKVHKGDDDDPYKKAYEFTGVMTYIIMKDGSRIVSERFEYDEPNGYGVVFNDKSLTSRDISGTFVFKDLFRPTKNITLYYPDTNIPDIVADHSRKTSTTNYNFEGNFKVYNKKGDVVHEGYRWKAGINTGSPTEVIRNGIVNIKNKRLVYEHILKRHNNGSGFEIKEFNLYKPNTKIPILEYRDGRIVEVDTPINSYTPYSSDLEKFGIDEDTYLNMSKYHIEFKSTFP